MSGRSPSSHKALHLGLAMVASLWIHVLGLALLQYADPIPAAPNIMPITLELETPVPRPEKPQEITADTTRETLPKPTPTPAPQPATVPAVNPVPTGQEGPAKGTPLPDEDTISLESKAPQYVSYLAKVKAAVKSRWIFPPAAREKRQTGRLTAMFTLDKSGSLVKIVVEESSHNEILDHAALEAVRGAAPFPRFPEHIMLERLNIRAHFDYRVRYVKME